MCSFSWSRSRDYRDVIIHYNTYHKQLLAWSSQIVTAEAQFLGKREVSSANSRVLPPREGSIYRTSSRTNHCQSPEERRRILRPLDDQSGDRETLRGV